MPHPPDDWSTAPLLVRRLGPDDVSAVAALLAPSGLTQEQVQAAARVGGLLVLGELGQLPSTNPLAAIALDLAPDGRAAQVLGVVVVERYRRQGLGLRLLTDTVTLLRAEGFSRLEGRSRPGSATDGLFRRIDHALRDDGPVGPGAAAHRLVLDL